MQNQPSSLTFNNNTTNQQYYSTEELKTAEKKLLLDTWTTRTAALSEMWLGVAHKNTWGVDGWGRSVTDRDKTNWILKHHVNWRHPAYSNSYFQLSSVWEKCFLLRSLLSQRKTTLFNVIFQVIPSRLNIVALVEWSMCLVCHQTKNNPTHD